MPRGSPSAFEQQGRAASTPQDGSWQGDGGMRTHARGSLHAGGWRNPSAGRDRATAGGHHGALAPGQGARVPRRFAIVNEALASRLLRSGRPAPVVHVAALLGAVALLFAAAACGGSATSAETKAGEAPRGRRVAASRQVFDAVSRSVVAVTNDDKDDREAENKELEKLSGAERRTPKKIVEVSSRSKPMPHGTGFVIPGGRVATAAHVISRPDKLKL